MAKLLTNGTAAKLISLLGAGGGMPVRRGRGPRDDGSPSSVRIETAWRQTPTASAVLVTAAPLVWGTVLVNPDWVDHVYGTFGTPYSVAYPDLNGVVWLDLSIDLNQAETSGAVSVAFTEDDTVPVHDLAGLILHFPLSLWLISYTPADGETPAVHSGQRFFNNREPGAIDLTHILGPPLAPEA